MDFEAYLSTINEVSEELKNQETQMIELLEILKTAKKEKRQVFICGNGGSAGTAIHMAADFFKIAGLKAISLDDNVPLMTALINDEGWSELYVQQLERLFNPNDILITISVHGGSGEDKAGAWSQNLNNAIDYVNRNGGLTIGLSGFDGGQMKHSCNVCIVVPAESTPIIESFHVLLQHFITFALQDGDRK